MSAGTTTQKEMVQEIFQRLYKKEQKMKICALKFDPKKSKSVGYVEKEIDAGIIRFRLNDDEYYEIVATGEKLHIRSMSNKNLFISPVASNAFNVELI